MDGIRSPSVGGTLPGAAGGTGGLPTGNMLHRWKLDPATGAVTETQLDDRSVELPTLHPERVGRPHRYQYLVSEEPTAVVVRHDVNTDSSQAFDLGPERASGEAVFVPARFARAEDEGWLMALVTDRAGAGSELIVLDASEIGSGPVDRVQLPRAVPAGRCVKITEPSSPARYRAWTAALRIPAPVPPCLRHRTDTSLELGRPVRLFKGGFAETAATGSTRPATSASTPAGSTTTSPHGYLRPIRRKSAATPFNPLGVAHRKTEDGRTGAITATTNLSHQRENAIFAERLR